MKRITNIPILLYRGEHFDANFFYYSHVDIDHSFFLSRPKTLFVPKLNQTLAEEIFAGKVLPYSNVNELLKLRVFKKTLWVDERSLPASLYKKLSRRISLKNVSDELLKQRARKRKDELNFISKAVRITKKIFSELDFSTFRKENEIRNYLLIRTLELGLEPAFEPIVATGSASRFPHYRAGNRPLRDIVLIDYGVRYKNYCADLTRCFFLKKRTEEEKNYEKLKEMFYEIIDFLPQCKYGNELAAFIDKLYSKYELPLPPHSIGHGIGLEVHEFPRLSKKYADSIVGATMSIEPSAYFRNYGIRFEETIYFDGRRVKIL
jgi:Xaa-Pro aminopeptidase